LSNIVNFNTNRYLLHLLRTTCLNFTTTSHGWKSLTICSTV